MKIIKNRVYNQLDFQQWKEQAGFSKRYAIIDHLHTINQLIERANEYQITMHMIFIDYSKAFDSIGHKQTWESLENQGVPKKKIRILKNTYKNSKAYVRTDSKGEMFTMEKGVKQGNSMSSNLFNAVLEEVFRNLDWKTLR